MTISAGERVMGNTAAKLSTFTAAAASTVNSADQVNENGRGVIVVVDITVATTTSMVVKIQALDTASGKYVDLLTSAALSSVATTTLTLYPGLTAAANTIVSGVLPRNWRVTSTITGGASALTGTIGAQVIC